MRAALGFALVLAACSSDVALPMESSCNPLGANHCMTPWPSSVFEVDDPSSTTGRRLAIPQGTLPTNADGVSVDPTAWNKADGFSPAAPIVLSFPGGVSVAGLPALDNMDPSLAADSPTVILDMTTGQRVAHFDEVDAGANDLDSQAFFLRPAARLEGGHRYAIAITKHVMGTSGEPLDVTPGFAALRDGKTTDHSLLEKDRARLEEALDALDEAGFPKSDLVVAWDFTVASDDFLHRETAAARDRALAALQTHPIAFTILTDLPIDDGSVIKRRITGTLDAPLFLTNGGSAIATDTTIARDADGLPALQGFYQIPFTAIVPTCAYTAPAPVPMVMYGHGLLGDSSETAGGVQQTTASELCMIFVGTDMRGMSEQDTASVGRALNDATHADQVFEVLEQGIANHVTLAQALRTTFATQLFVDPAAGNKQLADPARVYYYGLSQGGILGTAVMAYEPTITRAALGVGAADYSMLLDRSADWPGYGLILKGGYPDALDDELVISLCQMRWDKTEGSGIVNSVLAGTATGVPAKQLLMQVALSDEQVPNIGSWWQARSMNIPVMGPSPTVPWGLQMMAAPLPGGSAIVIEDGGAPPAPMTNIPPLTQNPSMHDLTRTQPASRRQIGEFFNTGQIVNACSGACTCQTGACM
ncbi:MAG TPA: hypothetical protein VGF94_12800 [Kofleriaceae bacterium]|jgi:hypothetical protein